MHIKTDKSTRNRIVQDCAVLEQVRNTKKLLKFQRKCETQNRPDWLPQQKQQVRIQKTNARQLQKREELKYKITKILETIDNLTGLIS